MGNSLVYSTVFPAPAPSYGLGDADAGVEIIEGVPCLRYHQAHRARGVIVYLHANGVDLGMVRGTAHALGRAARMAVVAVEYPGYGAAPGPVSPSGAVAGATRVYNYLARRRQLGQKLLIVGRSIGTGVAMQMAAGGRLVAPPTAVVLISPFASIEEVGRRMLGEIGAGVTRGIFDSVAAARRVSVPLLILTGKLDTLTIPDDARAIVAASASGWRRLVLMPASTHAVLDWHTIHREIAALANS